MKKEMFETLEAAEQGLLNLLACSLPHDVSGEVMAQRGRDGLAAVQKALQPIRGRAPIIGLERALKEDKRCTGRTTRMIEHAKRLVDERRAVYIVMSPGSIDYGKSIAAKIGLDPHHVSWERGTSALGNFDWQTFELRGAHPNCVVLVDHFVIEERFGKLLEMWEAYDAG